MKRLRLFSALMAFLGLAGAAMPASARVQVSIDLSAQQMRVQSSTGSYVWPVSSGRSGFHTPHGSYAPTSLQRMHYSHKYHMSPMPYSIFFRGGYAIHGTYSTAQLGRPASHGCVRLSPGNAAALFAMVQREGASISISGTPPTGGTLVAHRARRAAPAIYAERARVPTRPLAYAPVGGPVYYPSVRAWQYAPVPYAPYGYQPYGY